MRQAQSCRRGGRTKPNERIVVVHGASGRSSSTEIVQRTAYHCDCTGAARSSAVQVGLTWDEGGVQEDLQGVSFNVESLNGHDLVFQFTFR